MRKVKKIIKRSILYSMYSQKKLKWFIEYKTVKPKESALKALDFNTLSSKKVLMLVPHSDDELIGGSQLIKAFGPKLNAFYFGFLGPNPPKNSAQIRLLELQKSSEKLNLTFQASTGHHTQELINLITETNPEIIALPFLMDWQPEHLQSGIILNQALQQILKYQPSYHPQICMYQISVPITEEFITHFLPMSKAEHLSKWRVFSEVYSSQSYIPAPRFMLQEKISGHYLGHHAAEVFTMLSYNEWRSQLSKVVAYDIKNFRLDEKIGNIKQARMASRQLSEKFLR